MDFPFARIRLWIIEYDNAPFHDNIPLKLGSNNHFNEKFPILKLLENQTFSLPSRPMCNDLPCLGIALEFDPEKWTSLLPE